MTASTQDHPLACAGMLAVFALSLMAVALVTAYQAGCQHTARRYEAQAESRGYMVRYVDSDGPGIRWKDDRDKGTK